MTQVADVGPLRSRSRTLRVLPGFRPTLRVPFLAARSVEDSAPFPPVPLAGFN